MKKDVLREAARYGGLILTHQETTETGEVLPVWIYIDEAVVKTAKEIYDDFKGDGWAVDYHRFVFIAWLGAFLFASC